MSLIFALIVIFAATLVAAASIGHVVAENNMLRALLSVRAEQVSAARRSARREGRLAARALRRAEFAEARERAASRAEILLRARVLTLEASLQNAEARCRAAEALLDCAVEEAVETAGRLRSAESLLFLDEEEDAEEEPGWGASPAEISAVISEVQARLEAGWWPEEDAPLAAAS